MPVAVHLFHAFGGIPSFDLIQLKMGGRAARNDLQGPLVMHSPH